MVPRPRFLVTLCALIERDSKAEALMKTTRILAMGMAVLGCGLAFATGTERGGGTSPAPIFMPEAVTYRCEIKLTQLGSSLGIHRAFVSRSEFTAEWKEKEYGGRRGADLKDLNWKHYELKQIGPFHPTEVEVPSAPAGAKFEGYLAFNVEHLASPPELGIVLTTAVTADDSSDQMVSESYSAETIASKGKLTGNTRYIRRNSAGSHEDERSLQVTCSRS